jgi:hypothetical protein
VQRDHFHHKLGVFAAVLRHFGQKIKKNGHEDIVAIRLYKDYFPYSSAGASDLSFA